MVVQPAWPYQLRQVPQEERVPAECRASATVAGLGLSPEGCDGAAGHLSVPVTCSSLFHLRRDS